MMKRINSARVAAAIGPYSHASIIGKTIYLSGQLGLTVQGELISDNVLEQTKQALENIQKILEDCCSRLNNVIKVTVFLTDMSYFAEVNKIYAQYFDTIRPSRSCVEVSQLPKGAQIEIEIIAYES